ncbi:hypothetical protein ACWOMK_25705 [Bacillus thuringiensis]|uniref:hypothetical protein n=1 Tax=Bacillus tropicus TaxID=2026188 RepID=UPI0035E03D36
MFFASRKCRELQRKVQRLAVFFFLKDYTTSYEVPREVTFKLVTTIVKEYNQLKKELKMEYNEDELKIGIPEIIKEFREIS